MFQVKDFASIILGMTNRAKALQNKITDFRVGSVARTLFESPAAEIDELYQQIWIGLKEAIPVAIYNTFSFDLLAAKPSTGIVRVSITSTGSDTLISAGSLFNYVLNSGSFTTLQDYIITAGNTYIDCFVEATVPGSIGDTPSGAAFTISPSVSGLVSAVAISKFARGTDKETEAQRKIRFGAYILTINRGTVEAIRYGLSLASVTDSSGNIVEQAIYREVSEPWLTDSLQPVALVNCYIHNGVNGASTALLADAQKRIDGYYDSNGSRVPGWKAAGVKVVVQSAESVLVATAATLKIDAGYLASTVIDAVKAAIGEYIAALPIGSDVLRAEIISAAIGVDGVGNIYLSAPAADVAISYTQKAAIGAFTLSAP